MSISLTGQWAREIKKSCPKLKVIKILTKNHHKKLIYNDIITSDIIIVSQQFLMNFKYYPRLQYNNYTTPSIISFDKRKEHLKKVLDKYKESQNTYNININNIGSPILEHFYFHRFLIDEGHELLGEINNNASLATYISKWVQNVTTDNLWYISGTPFCNNTSLKNCLQIIKLKLNIKINSNNNINIYYNDKNLTNFNFLKKKYILDNILSKICIRHLEKDVSNEINIPGFTEELIWVELSSIERKLYDSRIGKSSNMVLQQICCHPLISESYKKIFGNECLNLNEMEDKLISYHQQKIDKYNKKLHNLNTNCQAYYLLKKSYETQITESNYVLSILNKMKNVIELKDNCVICYDIIKNPSLTPCGHIFCYDCIKACLNVNSKCPFCKANMKNKQIYMIKNNQKKENNMNPLIQKYGAKLGKIISMVRNLVSKDETRIIIFSQWERMLTLIGSSLAENGIENSFVKGNVWARNSAINKFKLGVNKKGKNNKVIMLSLKNAASGTNLTEATHIFFVEPINAPLIESKSIESQAIGRACRLGQTKVIKVIRVLVRNTIEEIIYNKKHNSNSETEQLILDDNTDSDISIYNSESEYSSEWSSTSESSDDSDGYETINM